MSLESKVESLESEVSNSESRSKSQESRKREFWVMQPSLTYAKPATPIGGTREVCALAFAQHSPERELAAYITYQANHGDR
jgi:hypothetical protein